MSDYERKRWAELQQHWQKKAERRQLMPPKARAAIESAARVSKERASTAGRAIAEVTPEGIKEVGGMAVGAALEPTLSAAARMLELLNEWVVELTDPIVVIRHHQNEGRAVTSLEDLRTLDLKQLDEYSRGMVLRWRTFGAGEGAGLGALAMIPVPVAGSAAAITLDFIAMQVLSGAIATRISYAYGFDATEPDVRHMIDRMVLRAYRNQAPKAGAVWSASKAFDAAKGRVNWSRKLRENHRLMAAVENLLKQFGDSRRVPVKNARMGMPFISVVVGAGTNAYVLGDVAKQARSYAATSFLSEKYGLELPANLLRDVDIDSHKDPDDDIGGAPAPIEP